MNTKTATLLVNAAPKLVKYKSYLYKSCAIITSQGISTSSSKYIKIASNPKPHWNRAVSEAEKVVGYPTSFLSLRWLLNDEFANIALHLRKLLGSNHPLLKTARNLFLNNNMATWGLIVLLVSKAGGLSKNVPDVDKDITAGVLHSQRALAEVTEMIRTSNIIHKSVVNTNSLLDNIPDMNFGNKMALLSGDYLLSNSYHELACLRNQNLNELMSSALRDLVEAEFIGPRDKQNMPLPVKPADVHYEVTVPDVFGTEPLNIDRILGNAKPEWTLRNILGGASLLGKSCQGTLKLAEHSNEIQERGFLFGKHLALAWQAYLEKEIFMHSNTGSFSLISAPVLFQLQHDHGLYAEIEKGLIDVEDVDYVYIRKAVLNGPAMSLTQQLQLEHSNLALEMIQKFPPTDARTALVNIITAMQDL